MKTKLYFILCIHLIFAVQNIEGFIYDINNNPISNASVSIPEIPAVNTRVEVIGRVKSPGLYPLDSGSLKNILDLAGGFNDPIFRKSILENEIVILRKDETNSYSKEFTVDYESSDTFQVVPGDCLQWQ